MLTVGVHDEEFMSWIKGVENQFVAMTETMIRVAEDIKHRVQSETVPIDTGRLSRSFKWHIVTDNSRMKVLQLQMSALNPKTGFDYAYTQHLGYRTSKSGRTVWYNHGLTDTGFFNYSQNILDEDKFDENTNYNVHHLQRGMSQYLYWGIIYEERSAFELIEHDYLSLFHGAFIDGGHIL